MQLPIGTCPNRGKCSINHVIGTLTLQVSVGKCYIQVTSNLNMSQLGKCFKQQYYRKINTLSLCSPVLLSGNVQSEHVAEVKNIQKTILSET